MAARWFLINGLSIYLSIQTCQFHQVATSLLKIRLVATCHLHTCCNMLKQLATSLSTACNRLVVNKLSQATRTHPDIGLLKQVVTRLTSTANWHVFGCVPHSCAKFIAVLCTNHTEVKHTYTAQVI